MLNNPVVDTRKVLVELSVIPFGSNGHTKDQIAEVLELVDRSGLYYDRLQNGTCIEGEWGEISPLLYACYERVQAQSPEGFLKVSIR